MGLERASTKFFFTSQAAHYQKWQFFSREEKSVASVIQCFRENIK